MRKMASKIFELYSKIKEYHIEPNVLCVVVSQCVYDKLCEESGLKLTGIFNMDILFAPPEAPDDFVWILRKKNYEDMKKKLGKRSSKN